MKKAPSHKQSGSSLIVVLAVLATLMVIVGIAAEYTTSINRHVQRSSTLGTAITVGDGCIDLLFANWRNTCRATPTTALATSAFSSIPLPTASLFPNLSYLPQFSFGASTTDYYSTGTTNIAISNFKVVAANAEWQPLTSTTAAPEPILGQIDQAITGVTDPALLDKTTPAVFNYIASADVTLPTLKGNVVARVRRVFQKQQISPWNFAIFYVDPLEIHPGPEFHVTGWVHTNSNLYTAHDTLHFEDKVTYASDWFVDFKPGDDQHQGETPQTPNYLGNLPPARDQALQPFGMDSTSIFSTTDTNPNNDSYRELIEQKSGSATDPLAGQRYYDQAAIKILIDASNNVTIKRYDGTTVTSSSSGSDKKLYNAVTGALTTNQSIQDNREGASVRLTTLDIGDIVTSLSSGGSSSIDSADSARWNGIIYISDTSASSSTHRGVRLINGEVLPTNGLTVASSNPIYIQGDYNTGSGTVPSNSTSNNDPTTPQSSGYTRRPASVVADAVNILSNSWNDSNAGSVPAASNTTINTAIIAGIVPTSAVGGDGAYSGGAENFPRFLENWNNKTLTYYGSMVQLYKSAQSIGEWGKGNVYSPPIRQWYFDTNFKTKPPPGTIMIYSYIKGKWSVL
jgi:hypothetical protein